jgi:mono/diheme cytochrome c family protein
MKPAGRSLGAFLLAAATLAVAPAARAWTPAVNYALNCQGCHLADGRATPGLVPALAGTVGRLVHVREGRDYLVRLPNVASTTLTDDETADLLNWVVRRFGATELPRDFAPFSAAEVARSRGTPLVDVDGARRATLEALAHPSVRR